MKLPSRPQIKQLESVVADHPSGFFALAAAPRQPLAVTAWPTSPRKTRVGVFRHRSSGQTSGRRRGRSMFTPGLRRCAYKTVSGRDEWLNRDPIGELGGINLYGYVENGPINLLDVNGLSVMTIIYQDGSKDRFQSPTIKALTDSLQKAANTGNLVDRLYIKGHGDEKDQYLTGGGVVGYIFGNSEWLEVKSGRIISGATGDDLTGLFLKALKSDALVALNGCETGRGQDSLAEQMSKLLPNRVVAGGQGWRQAAWLVGSSVSIGEKNYFINGEKVHSAW